MQLIQPSMKSSKKMSDVAIYCSTQFDCCPGKHSIYFSEMLQVEKERRHSEE